MLETQDKSPASLHIFLGMCHPCEKDQHLNLKQPRTEALDLTTTLREIKDPIIEVEYRACARSGSLDRKIMVKKHGAGVTFAQLRRMAAMGCDRLFSAEGDRCQTTFPCLKPQAPLRRAACDNG